MPSCAYLTMVEVQVGPWALSQSISQRSNQKSTAASHIHVLTFPTKGKGKSLV